MCVRTSFVNLLHILDVLSCRAVTTTSFDDCEESSSESTTESPEEWSLLELRLTLEVLLYRIVITTSFPRLQREDFDEHY